MSSATSLLQTFQLEHLPPSYAIHVALFSDVKNAGFLREQLLAGNQEFEYAFINAATVVSTTHALAAAFRAVRDFDDGRLRTRNVHSETVFSMNPSHNITDSFRRFGLSPDTTSLLVIKVTRFASSSSSTPTAAALQPQDELSANQPPATKGADTKQHSLPVLSASEVQEHLSKHVDGTQVPFTDPEVAKLTDVELVEKNYKLGAHAGGGGGGGGNKNKGGGGGGGGKTAMLPSWENLDGKDVKELEVAVMGAMALRSLV